MFKELRKKAGEETPTPPAVTSKKEAEAPAEPAPGEATQPDPELPLGDKKPKVNPWKLLDEYKSARKKLEQELADVRKLVPNEKERREEMDKLQKFEARAKELEEEIRYVNYQKSQEFQEKHQKPFQRALKSAMDELKEITITNEIGETRTVEPGDVLELVTMTMPKAREAAKNMFGDFADDVMAHRNTLKQLFDKQTSALEEARKNGEAREREQRELFERQSTEFQKFVSEAWKSANEEALQHEQYGKLFQPVEGDDEGNERLKKGYELVDKAFAESPSDPNLTTEQRIGVIKRHAAVRHRAAAFGRLRYQNDKLAKEVSDLKTKLKQYETSTPSTATVNQAGNATIPGSSTRSQVLEALHKLAK